MVAKAAQLVGEHRLHELTDELVTAFNRLMTQPAKRDKGGNGLTELVKTLTLLGYQDADLFAKGSFHVQMEPVYGGKVDVADHMRGWCAQGLAQSSGADALTHIGRLLADPCPTTRKAAVQAVEISGRADVGLPLLNFKITEGDDDPQVIGQCVTAILHLTDGQGLDWIKPLMDHSDDAVIEQTLLAMGQSRHTGLSKILQDFYEQTLEADIQKATLLALAMLRTDESLGFLVDLVEDGSVRAAEQAIDSLSIYSYDSRLREKLIALCQERDDLYLKQKVQTAFGS